MNTKVKKTLLFALMACVLTVFTVFSVSAKTVTKNKLVYKVNKTTATLVECKTNAKKITVPSKVGKYKVTAIGKDAFSGKKKLESVEIPSSVKKIGEEAFEKCTALKKIVIPSSVNGIGKNAFRGCKKLTAYVVKGSQGEKYIKKQKNVALGYRYMTSLKLDGDSVIINEGDSFTLEVTKKPSRLYNSGVSFSSADKRIAVVSSKGVITAKAPGTVKIICKAKDGSGKKAVCTVTVRADKPKKAVSLIPAAPTTVTGLKVAAATDSSVSLSWNKLNGVSGYKVYLYNAESKTYTLKGAVSSAQAEIKGLDCAKDYLFAVKAYNRNSYASADSVNYSATVKAVTLPGKVTEVMADESLIYPDRMTLSWKSVKGADGYNLYVYSKTEKDYVLYESTSALSCQVINLRPGTDYYFRLKTFSGSNKTEGSFSSTFTFTTDYLPSSPQQAAEDFLSALSATKNSGKSLVLNTRFDVTDFDGVTAEIQSVIDSLYVKERNTYIFENGKAVINGKEVSVTDVIYPFGKESALTLADIKKNSVAFSQSGFGYAVSFSVLPESAKKIAVLTDMAKVKSENPGFVLYSYETGEAKTEAKVSDGMLDYLLVSVPVKMTFILGGEKHEITYTVSQDYFIG